MIIGNGDIASILNDREGAIFFASGVSNSKETKESEFLREQTLLNKQDKNQCLFYFSSLTVDNIDIVSNNKYLQHKIKMENFIKSHFKNYNIIRIGNITWGTNPHTFINNIRSQIKEGKTPEIRDEYRYIITKDQLHLLTDNLPLKGQNVIGIIGKMVKVKDLI